MASPLGQPACSSTDNTLNSSLSARWPTRSSAPTRRSTESSGNPAAASAGVRLADPAPDSTETPCASTNVRHRGGTIRRLGEKRYRIAWHLGRGNPDIRRVIHGTREHAERASDALRARIPVTIAYWLGTRMGETIRLTWRQVRFDHARRLVEIQLDAQDTTTKEARRAFLGGDLYETLWAWAQASQPLQTPWVCHYHGRRLTSIRTSWYTACVKVGLGRFARPDAPAITLRQYRGLMPHDFRRTAVSRMEAAGIPRKIAMAISGHKTDSVYRRYHIVSQDDLEQAGQRLLAWHHTAEATDLNSVSREHVVNSSDRSSRANDITH